jgi:hypothetical protein
MRMSLTCLWAFTLLLAVAVEGQSPVRDAKGYVVAVSETTITISNVRLAPTKGADGQTFVMPAPKDGEPPPTWVSADSATAAPPPKMLMLTPADADGTPLELTEFQFEKGAVKPAEFPMGTHVSVKYRDAGATKQLQGIDRIIPKG